MGVGANSWNLIWLLVIYNLYKSCMHSHVIHTCTRVAAVAEEVVYEVVTEPQEPLEQAQQEERHENQTQGPTHSSSEQQPECKPRCMSYYFKL